MVITIACTACGQQLAIPESAMGHQVACPRCKAVIMAPDSSASIQPPLENLAPSLVASKSSVRSTGSSYFSSVARLKRKFSSQIRKFLFFDCCAAVFSVVHLWVYGEVYYNAAVRAGVDYWMGAFLLSLLLVGTTVVTTWFVLRTPRRGLWFALANSVFAIGVQAARIAFYAPLVRYRRAYDPHWYYVELRYAIMFGIYDLLLLFVLFRHLGWFTLGLKQAPEERSSSRLCDTARGISSINLTNGLLRTCKRTCCWLASHLCYAPHRVRGPLCPG